MINIEYNSAEYHKILDIAVRRLCENYNVKVKTLQAKAIDSLDFIMGMEPESFEIWDDASVQETLDDLARRVTEEVDQDY